MRNGSKHELEISCVQCLYTSSLVWEFGALSGILMGVWLFLVDIFQDQIKMSDYANKQLNSKPGLLPLPDLLEHLLPVKKNQIHSRY